MLKEETNYDTMRLIAGALDDKNISLDDIMQEFSSDSAVKTNPVPTTVQQPSEERSTDPISAVTDESRQTESHTESESDIADAIANAIASAYGDQMEDFSVQVIPEPKPNEPIKPAETPSAEPKQKTATPKQTIRHEQEPPPSAQKAEPKQNDETRTKPSNQPKKKDAQAVPNPGTAQKKIPAGKVRMSFAESFSLSFGGLLERQRTDLPENTASLKAAEKRNSFIVRLSAIFTPLRYVLVLFMVMAIAGRKYPWMLLGFLGSPYIAVAAVLVAMLSSWYSVLRCLKDFVYLRASFESLLLIATVISVLDVFANQNSATLLPLLVIGWCLCGFGSLMTVSANLRSLRTVITGKNRKAIRIAPNKWNRQDCIGKSAASTAGFVRNLEEQDTWHTAWTYAGVVLLIGAVVISGYLTAKTQADFLTLLSILLTAILPFGGALCCARPYGLLSRTLSTSGAVSGWKGMQAMGGKKAVMIYDEDLFPKGTITHKGIKAYGNHTSQTLVSCAASLILQSDNGLGEVFGRLLRETNGTVYDVTGFAAMESGASGYIQGVPVAVGTYQYMNLMGTLPPANAPKNGLFVAINRQVAGVFAIKYNVQGSSAGGLRRLLQERNLTKLVVTKSFVVNPSFIERRFRVPASGIVCPKYETRRKLSHPSQMARGTTCGFLLHDGIAAYGRMIAGGRRGHRSAKAITLIAILYAVYMLIRLATEVLAGSLTLGALDILLYQGLLFLLTEICSRTAVK